MHIKMFYILKTFIMINQNILSISNNSFVVHEGNLFAYQYLIKSNQFPKKIILYGNTDEILEFIFTKFDFVPFSTLDEYKKYLNFYIFIDLNKQNLDLDQIFFFLNYIINKDIFLIIKSDQYPINTNIKDLNSRLNSFDNIYVNNSTDLSQFTQLIKLYFKDHYVNVNPRVIKFLLLRLSPNNLKSKIDTICNESLRQNKKITVPFIKNLNIIWNDKETV